MCKADTFTGQVVGVADGDTLTVMNTAKVQQRIRLAGIDAPERAQPFGQRSKQQLSDLVYGTRRLKSYPSRRINMAGSLGRF